MNFIHKIIFALKQRDDTVENGIRYGQSRRLFIWDAALSQTITGIASGTFVAGLVKYLGGSDSVNGLIGSFAVLTSPVMIFAAYFYEKLKKRKAAVLSVAALCKVLSGLLFFIPFLLNRSEIGLPLFLGMFFFINALANFAGPGALNWIVDLVPERMRGYYFAKREAVCMALQAAVSLVIGLAVDFLNTRVNETVGFVVFGSVILALTVCNIIALLKIDEPPAVGHSQVPSLGKVITLPFRHRRFVRILIYGILWNVGLMFGLPFMTVYQISGLGLSYSYIMALSLVSMGLRTFLIPQCGKLAQRKGFRFVAVWSVTIIAVSTFMWVFVNPSTVMVLLPLIYLISAFGWAGLNLSMFNLQIQSMPGEIRMSCISVNNAMLGLIGFLSTLAASRLLSVLGDFNVTVNNFGFSSMQIVFLVSGGLLLVCLGYLVGFRNRIGGE